MIDILYKLVKPSHLKKLQNVNDLIFQVIFILSDWIVKEQIIASFRLSDYQKNAALGNE